MHPLALLDVCTELLRLLLKFEHPADAVIARYFQAHRNLGPRERATVSESVYAVLRLKLLFEKQAQTGSGPHERRLALLGLAHSLGRRRPQDHDVTHAAHEPAAFIKNALAASERTWLEHCERQPLQELEEPQRHNLPEWLAQTLQQQLGAEFEPMLQGLQPSQHLDLRVNTLLAKRAAVQQELKALGYCASPTPYSPWGLRVQGKPALGKLHAYTRGAIEVQDEGSQLLALLLNAQRGELVVDFCAGAGGKTLALGAAMRNTGRLYAFDTSAHRLDALKPRLARSGLSNVYLAQIAHERDERIERLSGKIDRVLVDAPCSGLGTLRRNPDLKWRQSPQGVQELASRQTAILAGAARLLKPGARLVYATCSILAQENEAVAASFTASHPDLRPLPAAQLLTQLKVADAVNLSEGRQSPGLYLRLWPHRHQTDGFFAAIWQKC